MQYIQIDFEGEDESPIRISISGIFISWESKSNDFLLSYREAKRLGRGLIDLADQIEGNR